MTAKPTPQPPPADPDKLSAHAALVAQLSPEQIKQRYSPARAANLLAAYVSFVELATAQLERVCRGGHLEHLPKLTLALRTGTESFFSMLTDVAEDPANNVPAPQQRAVRAVIVSQRAAVARLEREVMQVLRPAAGPPSGTGHPAP